MNTPDNNPHTHSPSEPVTGRSGWGPPLGVGDYRMFGAIVGAILGGILSYWLQAGIVRAAFSLGAYLAELPKICQDKGFGDGATRTVWLAIIICAAIGMYVGNRLYQSPRKHSSNATA